MYVCCMLCVWVEVRNVADNEEKVRRLKSPVISQELTLILREWVVQWGSEVKTVVKARFATSRFSTPMNQILEKLRMHINNTYNIF